MAWWNIFGGTATSDSGRVIQRVSENTSVASDGTSYTRMGNTTVGSDGSVFTQMGNFSSDGSARMGSGATGIGAVFNKSRDDSDEGSRRSGHRHMGFDSDDF